MISERANVMIVMNVGTLDYYLREYSPVVLCFPQLRGCQRRHTEQNVNRCIQWVHVHEYRGHEQRGDLRENGKQAKEIVAWKD
jgi:hypothetical protein